jgi:DNA modification methylase
MDNFSGDGATMVSWKNNKLNGIGIDLSANQIEIIKIRLQDIKEDWYGSWWLW